MLDEEAAEHRPDREREAETPAQVPIALPRSSGGNALEMIDSVPGIISAAPLPCSSAADDEPRLRLGEADERAADSANTTTPVRNTVRRPKMSPRRPPVTSRTAKVSV